MREVADKKSKVNHIIIQHKEQAKLTESPAYNNCLTSRDYIYIFSIRSRMVKLKANFKKAYTDTQYVGGAKTTKKLRNTSSLKAHSSGK